MPEYDARVSNYASVIPHDLKIFDKEDIRKTFVYMQQTFHLHKDWYGEFTQQLRERRAGMSEVEFFFRYAIRNLDPPLKTILRRKESVILSLCRYIVRDKVKGRPRASQQSKYHR